MIFSRLSTAAADERSHRLARLVSSFVLATLTVLLVALMVARELSVGP